MHFTLHH